MATQGHASSASEQAGGAERTQAPRSSHRAAWQASSTAHGQNAALRRGITTPNLGSTAHTPTLRPGLAATLLASASGNQIRGYLACTRPAEPLQNQWPPACPPYSHGPPLRKPDRRGLIVFLALPANFWWFFGTFSRESQRFQRVPPGFLAPSGQMPLLFS